MKTFRISLLSGVTALIAIYTTVACGRMAFNNSTGGQDQSRIEITNERVDHYLQGRQAEPPILPNGKNAVGVGVLDLLVAPADPQGSASIRSCTAVFVEGDVIVNAHCVPAAVRNQSVSCNTLLFKLGGQKKGIACRKILWAPPAFDASNLGKGPDLSNFVADVVVFSLKSKPVGAKSLRLSKTFLQPAKDYSLWSYQETWPPPSNYTFDFSSQPACRISQADLAPKSFPFRTIDCLIKPENSGSPLMSNPGTVQAIASTRMFNEKKEPLGTLVVDLACLDHKHGQYSWRADCPLTGKIQLVTN